MLTDPQTFAPAVCAHQLTRDEGCIPCEATSFASDEDGTIDHGLADAFEAWATESARANAALAGLLIDLEAEAGFIADYPLPHGGF